MQHTKNFDETGCYYAAIDIGSSNITTLVGRQSNDNKIEIVAHSCVPSKGVVRGDIRNTNDVVTAITQSINKIEEDFGIKIHQAYVGLTGQHIKFMQKDGYVSINNKEGEVTGDDVIRLSKEMNSINISPGEAIIHILPQSYCIDDDAEVIEPIGMVGNRLNGVFNIITGNNSSLLLIKRCLGRANVEMSTIILSALASAEAVLVDDSKELGVVVVDLGGGATDVCIYHDKTMRYLGVIPIGGETINKDIRAMGVLERLVEKLKIKFGSAFSDNVADNQIIKLQGPATNEILQKDLAMAIEARVMDIIEELEQMIDTAGFTNKLKGGMILTGGCAQLKDIDKLFARHFKCEVRIAKPNLYVTPDSYEHVDHPGYSTAVGLLLRASIIGIPSKIDFIIKAPEPQPTYITTQPTYTQQYQHAPSQRPAAVNPDQTAEKQPIAKTNNKASNNQPQRGTPRNEQIIDTPIDDDRSTDNIDDYSTGEGNIFKRALDRLRKIVDPEDDDLEDNKIQ